MTQPGRMIAVVGPSGVGKDSVMEGIAAADPRFKLVRRVITRDPEAGGEDYDPVSPEAFADMVAQGAFCLHWEAHGLQYGIPATCLDDLAEGTHWLVNLSRTVLTQAHNAFPDFVVLNLSAKPETLAARVRNRGRESADDIAKRLARKAAEIPPHLNVITLSNDGDLDETIRTACARLAPQKASP